MKFSEFISESEMQILLRKKLALEQKLDKTKRNSNRQKILDELAEISKNYTSKIWSNKMKFSEFKTLNERDTDEIKYLYFSLVNNGIEAKVEKAFGSKAYIGMNYDRDGIRIVIKPSDGKKVDGATYKKVLSKVKKDIEQIISDENLRGYTIKSDDEAIWVLN